MEIINKISSEELTYNNKILDIQYRKNKLGHLKKKIQQIKAKLETEYQIDELGLFGSYVRGEETKKSDIDLLISFKPSARFGLVKYCKLQNIFSDRLGKKVDLVMKKGLKPYIGEQILKEVIYL
ncbi:nucleotidyltransferase family protein [Cyanobacterium stanieri LEGE 03274]|uniref:Nucleotidyltransferase family protein n=1 Tax=Cyanobacterium stanieri LEGE 03274 TaxID=1828756 RepID=A0ABR9V378_9CHRO|nr:nucleotidyltransferase family protein [Cyanobacterium stanieri]MBE9221586.1 nucleotidyltransferase family protein [Cyanobacterium stanieri LEGE 03274]